MASMNGLRRSQSATLDDPLLHNGEAVETLTAATRNLDSSEPGDIRKLLLDWEELVFYSKETMPVCSVQLEPFTVTANCGLVPAAEHLASAVTSVGGNLENAMVSSTREICHTMERNVKESTRTICTTMERNVKLISTDFKECFNSAVNSVQNIACCMVVAFIAYLVFLWLTMPQK